MALPRDLTPSHFPGRPPCFPRSVGRAFTPAAPWRIQKWRVCGIAGSAFSRVATGLAPVRRGGFHIRPGRLCRRTVRRGEGTPPYGRPVGRGCPGWPKTQNLFVGAGFTAPAGAFRRPTAAQRRLLGRRTRPRVLAAARGPRDDASIVPYRGLQHCRVRVFPVGHGPCPCS